MVSVRVDAYYFYCFETQVHFGAFSIFSKSGFDIELIKSDKQA